MQKKFTQNYLYFPFIIAELASIKLKSKSNSGLTNWVGICIGRKTSFITSYMFWFANLFYFVGAVPARLNYIGFGFTGQDFTDDPTFNQVIPFVAVTLFAVITLISTLNTKKISRFTSVSAWVILGLTGLFFVVAIIGWIAGAAGHNLPNTEAPGLVPTEDLDIWGDAGALNFSWISMFIWVLMAADGAQSLGVYVNDTRGGRKVFSKTIIIAVLLIGFTYIFGTLLVSVFPPKVEGEGDLANNMVNAYFNMFYFIFSGTGMTAFDIQKMTYIIIGLSYTFTLGGILVWTSAPVRTFFSEIPTGVFGSSLPKQNRNGAPVFGAWIQFIIVTPLLLIPTLGIGELSQFFDFIKTSSGWIGMIPPLIIFLAYFNLRLRKDKTDRYFRMGNRTVGLLISGFMILIFTGILILTFLEVDLSVHPSEWGTDWYLVVSYKVGSFLVLVLPIYLWYLRYERMVRDTKIARELKIDEKLVLKKYLISKKSNQYFYIDIVNWKIKKINEINQHYAKIFDELDYSKKNSNLIYNKHIAKKKLMLQEVEKKYKDLVIKRKNQLKNEINQAYLKMNDHLNKFRIFQIINGSRKFEFSKWWANRKYRANFMEDAFSNRSFLNFEIESSKNKEQNVIYTAAAIKTSPSFASKNVFDRIELTNNEVIVYYMVNGQYQKFKFDHNESVVVFREKTKNIVRYNQGKKIELNLIELISTKNNNIWNENVYIENFEEFKNSYLKVKATKDMKVQLN